MLPPALRYRIGSDGELTTTRTEPIAQTRAPARTGRTTPSSNSSPACSGSVRQLRRREQQRRNRRLFAFSCFRGGRMVLTTSLAAYALLQRAAAQRQTQRAEAEAQTPRRRPGFLVDLFKISDPGEARGTP